MGPDDADELVYHDLPEDYFDHTAHSTWANCENTFADRTSYPSVITDFVMYKNKKVDSGLCTSSYDLNNQKMMSGGDPEVEVSTSDHTIVEAVFKFFTAILK